jgi:hypothetical protein
VLLIGATVAACARGKEKGDSTGGAASLPGALAKPIEQYTPDEFYGFVHALAFGGGADRPRKCKKTPGCESKGGKQTTAHVDAVDGQDSITVSALPANGLVAVKAKNTGKYEEDRYSMLPGDFEYYLIVRPAGADSARWSMQQLSTAPGGRSLTQVASGTFVPCGHPFRKRTNRANFYTCAGSKLANDSTMRMGLMREDALMDPIWVTCGAGCCTFQ